MNRVVVLLLAMLCGLRAWAQDTPNSELSSGAAASIHASLGSPSSPYLVSATAVDPSAASPEADPGGLPANPTPQFGASTSGYNGWHGSISIYGWFPGIHGTVGVLGHDASIHAPFSDVFHFLKGVIPIAVEVDKGRFLMPIDFFWVKRGDDKGIPLSDPRQTSINIHITESILTPKFGYRFRWRAFESRCLGPSSTT